MNRCVAPWVVEKSVLTQGHRAVLARWNGSQGSFVSPGVPVGDCGKYKTCIHFMCIYIYTVHVIDEYTLKLWSSGLDCNNLLLHC